MLHTAYVVVRFIVLFTLFFVVQHYLTRAVDRWCDFCEGLWRFEEELKESRDNP